MKQQLKICIRLAQVKSGDDIARLLLIAARGMRGKSKRDAIAPDNLLRQKTYSMQTAKLAMDCVITETPK